MSNLDLSELDDLEMELNALTQVDDTIDARSIHPTVSMAVEYRNPHDLQFNPWNPNSVDPINQQKLVNSIKLEGIKRPIVVRETEDGFLQIIGGQHRTLAAMELKMESVPVINRGRINDTEAKRETLLDNFRYGSDNLDRLSELLADPDIGDATSLLETMPIDEEELAEYFSHLTSTDLDMDIDESLGELPQDEEEDDLVDLGAGKPVKTHQIIRFRVSIEDQAKLAELLKKTKIDEGLVESDDLTNDGDALVHLLRDLFE